MTEPTDREGLAVRNPTYLDLLVEKHAGDPDFDREYLTGLQEELEARGRLIERLEAELERLRAENVRLHQALERIATSAWVYDPAGAAVRMITIAEAALAGEPEREHA